VLNGGTVRRRGEFIENRDKRIGDNKYKEKRKGSVGYFFAYFLPFLVIFSGYELLSNINRFEWAKFMAFPLLFLGYFVLIPSIILIKNKKTE